MLATPPAIPVLSRALWACLATALVATVALTGAPASAGPRTVPPSGVAREPVRPDGGRGPASPSTGEGQLASGTPGGQRPSSTSGGRRLASRTAAVGVTGAGSAIQTTDRSAVAAAYRDVYQPTMAVPAATPTSDAVAGCTAGVTPAALQRATLDLVNYFRRMSGVEPVTFDPALSGAAQKAALMMYANNRLSHAPTRDWRCFSADGADAAAHSHLSQGYPGAAAVRAYMDDAGPGGTTAGHRWWLQRPSTQTMGNGTFGGANALWVSGATGFSDGPQYTSWPSAGYFPAGLEPNGRWSFTAWNPDQQLDQATVTVTGPDGSAVPVAAQPVDPAFGSLVFEVGALPRPTGSAVDTYTVTVSGIHSWGEPLSPYRYQVRLFDPAGDAPVEITALHPPVITGAAQVGGELAVQPPSWSQPGVSTTYQWLRNGSSIPAATGTTYTLTAADAGATISVRASGSQAGAVTGTAAADGVGPVRKIPATVTLAARSPDQGRAEIAVMVTAAGHGDGAGLGGTVSVHEGATAVAAGVAVTDGAAAVTLTGAAPGPHTYTVTYSGTAAVAAASRSTTVSVRDRAAAKLTVTSSSTAVGRLQLAVAVTAAGEAPLGGTVRISEGSTTVRSGLPVTAGKASWTGSGLKAGTHRFVVHYDGTRRVKATSRTVTATVKAKAKPQLRLTGTSSGSGKVAVTTRVTADGKPATGTLTVKEGSKTWKAGIALRSGTATWSASRMKAGRHTYTVLYSGSSQVLAGTAKVSVTIKK